MRMNSMTELLKRRIKTSFFCLMALVAAGTSVPGALAATSMAAPEIIPAYPRLGSIRWRMFFRLPMTGFLCFSRQGYIRRCGLRNSGSMTIARCH